MNSCQNTSSTPVNLQWWTYPTTSPLVLGSQVDGKVVATCPATSAASNSTAGNTTGTTTTTTSGVFLQASATVVAVLGALYF